MLIPTLDLGQKVEKRYKCSFLNIYIPLNRLDLTHGPFILDLPDYRLSGGNPRMRGVTIPSNDDYDQYVLYGI